MPVAARRPSGVGLVFLDLDGTIVHAGVEVSPRVGRALKAAHEAGWTLAVSSGRPLGMVPKAVRELGIMDWYLCCNGAEVHDATGALVRSSGMPGAQVRAMMATVSHLHPRWYVMADGRSWAERRNVTYLAGGAGAVKHLVPRSVREVPRQAKRVFWGVVHRLFGERGRRLVRSIAPIVTDGRTFAKVGCSFSSATAAREAARTIRELGGFEVALVWKTELEITAAGVDKGSAADWLAERLGIAREQTVAFGDSENDAPLAGHVGTLVAVANADEALLQVADDVCASLADDGVALWIEQRLEG